MTTSKYKLYYSPGACSLAVHALLNEVKANYTTEKVDLKKPRTPEFSKVNPRGAVPVLEIADTVKQIDAQGYVLDTIDRQHLRAVQTPQVFQAALLRQAHGSAAVAGSAATDDAKLISVNY